MSTLHTLRVNHINKPNKKFSRRTGSSRQERGPNSNNIARPLRNLEVGRPQVGLSYKQITNTPISVLSWAAPGVKDITITATPTAAMIALFDEYRVLSARVRFIFTPDNLTKITYGYPLISCFDPSGSATVTSYETALAYRNSMQMYLTAMQPFREYLIRRCTHLDSSGSTLLQEPLKTDIPWIVGHDYVASPAANVVPIIFDVSYTIEFEIEYLKPRSA